MSWLRMTREFNYRHTHIPKYAFAVASNVIQQKCFWLFSSSSIAFARFAAAAAAARKQRLANSSEIHERGRCAQTKHTCK